MPPFTSVPGKSGKPDMTIGPLGCAIAVFLVWTFFVGMAGYTCGYWYSIRDTHARIEVRQP